MIIAGASGMAKEIFEILHQNNNAEEIFFFDDVTPNLPEQLYNTAILRSIAEAGTVFQKSNNFVLGLGNPLLREKVYQKFMAIHGKLNSVISPYAQIGKFGNELKEGCNIMMGVVITNNVSIGKAALVNINASISHDTLIGDFVEISPGATIAGKCRINDYAIIGANATILPGIVIGKYAVVGAGAVVTKDVAENTIVAGVPARPLLK